MIWHTVRRLLINEADAADCFQRTFVSALELSRKEPISNWQPLLKRLATVRAIDALRQRQRRNDRHEPFPDEGRIDTRAADPHQRAETSELTEQLRAALSQLDPRQSEIFCLACLEDMSYHEIAEQLGLTVNHVGVLLNRARTSLRERLQAHRPTLANPRLPKESRP